MHLEQAAQECAEAPEERLPEGVFLDTLFARVKVVVVAGVILNWHHWLLINTMDGQSLLLCIFWRCTGGHVHVVEVHCIGSVVEAVVFLGQGLHN